MGRSDWRSNVHLDASPHLYQGIPKEVKPTSARTPAFHQGYSDFFAGSVTNRYRLSSHYAKEWQHGFDVAYFDNLKAITESA